MIKPSEVHHYARKNAVRDTQIEKDYILTWILLGMSKHQLLSKSLIFKGGTVLKKVYYENY
jgi:predicted nucleotidyltransferase component of viral defense system